MAFPTVESLIREITGSASTSHTISYPATVSSGDLLLCIIGVGDETNDVGWPGTWTEIQDANDGATSEFSIGYRIADGTEGGGSFSVSFTASNRRASHLYRISGWHGATVPEVGTLASGTSATPDPPSLSPSWGAEDTLWIAYARSERGDNTYTGAPTNYTNLAYDNDGAGAGAGAVASARRELNASSEDPGAFTPSSSAAWIANTVAVRPAASTTFSLASIAGAATTVATLTAISLGMTAAAAGSSTTSLDAHLIRSMSTAAAGVGAAAVGMANDYPIRLSASGRYLEKYNGTPFLLAGDTGWSMFNQLSTTDAATYLADRAGKGINAVLANAIEHQYADNKPNNDNNDYPWTGTAFQSSETSAFWAQVDTMLTSARDNGIVVFFDVLYSGSAGGWYTEIMAAADADMTTYGSFLGNRYKEFPNIVWVIGGDYNPAADATMRGRYTALADAILAADPYHIITEHSLRGIQGIEPWVGVGVPSWLTLNSVYTDDGTTIYLELKKAYSNTTYSDYTFFYLEGIYENEGATAQELRSQLYYSSLSGASGALFGNCPIWHFSTTYGSSFCTDNGWANNLDTQGITNVQHYQTLFEARNWHLLTPDFTDSIVTSGQGTAPDYIAAAVASDGSSLIVYIPTEQSFTIDASGLSGTADVWWYNPTTGNSFYGGTASAAAGQGFSSPSDADWVLVLDAQSENFSPPGNEVTIAMGRATTSATLEIAAVTSTASADGVASTAVTLNAIRSLSSAADGVATTTLTMSVGGQVEGTTAADGVATTSAALHASRALSAAAAGTSTTSLTLSAGGQVVGTASADGVATVTLSLVALRSATTSAAGTSTVTLTASAIQQTATAMADGTSTVTLTFSAVRYATAAANGLSTVTLSAAKLGSATAQADGTSTVTLSANAVRALVSAADGLATTSTDLHLIGAASTAAAGTSTVTLSITAIKSTSSAADGVATVTVDLDAIRAPGIVVTGGTSTVSLTLNASHVVTTRADGAGSVTLSAGLSPRVRAATTQADGSSFTVADLLVNETATAVTGKYAPEHASAYQAMGDIDSLAGDHASARDALKDAGV